MLSASRRWLSARRSDRRAPAAVVYVCLAVALTAAGDQAGGMLLIVALAAAGVLAGYFIAEGWAPALALAWLVIGVVARDGETSSIIGGMILAVPPAAVAAATLGAGALVAKRMSGRYARR